MTGRTWFAAEEIERVAPRLLSARMGPFDPALIARLSRDPALRRERRGFEYRVQRDELRLRLAAGDRTEWFLAPEIARIAPNLFDADGPNCDAACHVVEHRPGRRRTRRVVEYHASLLPIEVRDALTAPATPVRLDDDRKPRRDDGHVGRARATTGTNSAGSWTTGSRASCGNEGVSTACPARAGRVELWWV